MLSISNNCSTDEQLNSKHTSENNANTVKTMAPTCQHQCQSLHEWSQGLTLMDLLLQASDVQPQLSSFLPIPSITTKTIFTV